jgi:hypothetical protein
MWVINQTITLKGIVTERVLGLDHDEGNDLINGGLQYSKKRGKSR